MISHRINYRFWFLCSSTECSSCGCFSWKPEVDTLSYYWANSLAIHCTSISLCQVAYILLNRIWRHFSLLSGTTSVHYFSLSSSSLHIHNNGSLSRDILPKRLDFITLFKTVSLILLLLWFATGAYFELFQHQEAVHFYFLWEKYFQFWKRNKDKMKLFS